MSDGPIDLAVFRDLQDAMGADFVDELVTTFLDEAAGMRSDMKSAAAQANADAFRRAAHSIKSNANVFGASDLAEHARRLELSEVPQTEAAADTVLAVFDTEYNRATAALRELLNG